MACRAAMYAPSLSSTVSPVAPDIEQWLRCTFGEPRTRCAQKRQEWGATNSEQRAVNSRQKTKGHPVCSLLPAPVYTEMSTIYMCPIRDLFPEIPAMRTETQ